MAEIFIDEHKYEDFNNRLNILQDILTTLMSDSSIENMHKILSDYQQIEDFFKKNRQHMLEIEIININGILDSSRSLENESISKTFQDLKDRIGTMNEGIKGLSSSLSSKKDIINDITSSIQRLDNTVECIEKLKSDFIDDRD